MRHAQHAPARFARRACSTASAARTRREHGSVASRELLHLLLHDQRFAWLRSALVHDREHRRRVDADEPIAPRARVTAFRDAIGF
jgi:hypothetical protein